MKTEIDLFDNWQELPKEVIEVLESFEDETYSECERILNELKPLGYTFEYYLDAQPFNLKKI